MPVIKATSFKAMVIWVGNEVVGNEVRVASYELLVSRGRGKYEFRCEYEERVSVCSRISSRLIDWFIFQNKRFTWIMFIARSTQPTLNVQFKCREEHST